MSSKLCKENRFEKVIKKQIEWNIRDVLCIFLPNGMFNLVEIPFEFSIQFCGLSSEHCFHSFTFVIDIIVEMNK